jgi:hypothetical protein
MPQKPTSSTPPKRQITIEVDAETYAYLEVLAAGAFHESDPTITPVYVLQHLAHSAADGMRRPGAWERDWIVSAFGDAWIKDLEVVPDVPYVNLRPKRVHRGT